MARRTTHPEGLKEVHAIKIDDKVKEFVRTLDHDIRQEKTNRETWEHKQDAYRDLRYGYRMPKTTPWKGCANYSIPLIDAHINKVKPSYINLTRVTPVVSFVPFSSDDIEAAKKRETLFDWRLRTKVKPFEQYVIGTDKELEQGSVVYKTWWEFTTREYSEEIDLEELDKSALEAFRDERMTDEMIMVIIIQELGIDSDFEENVEAVKKAVKEFREGKTLIGMDLIEVEQDRAQITARSIRDDIVVPLDTTDLQFARFIDDPFWRTTTQVKTAMKDEKYESYPDNEIKGWASTGTDVNKKKRVAELSSSQDDNILFHEVCCWYETDDSGIKKRCIVTYPDSNPSDILRFIEVPYDHGEFPYDQVRRELNDDGFYTSRGIPALDADFQIGISQAMNQAENNGTITNSPVIVSQRNTVTNIKNRRFIPGEHVETNGPPDNYQIRQGVNISQPILFQLAQYLKSWADQRIGNVTSGLSEVNNLPGAGEGGKKTKAEVDLISSLQGEVQSLDLQVHQQQMAKVYFKVDALYQQFGDDEEEVLITGEEPQTITRREIQGRFDMVPNGRLDNTNPVLKANKAFNLLRIFKDDPDIKQRDLKKFFLREYDEKAAQLLFVTDKEKQTRDQIQIQTAEQLKQRAIKEGVDLKQVDIMLDVWKESLLTPITGRKYAPDRVRGSAVAARKKGAS